MIFMAGDDQSHCEVAALNKFGIVSELLSHRANSEQVGKIRFGCLFYLPRWWPVYRFIVKG